MVLDFESNAEVLLSQLGNQGDSGRTLKPGDKNILSESIAMVKFPSRAKVKDLRPGDKSELACERQGTMPIEEMFSNTATALGTPGCAVKHPYDWRFSPTKNTA
jgi:hypothetical protein